MQRESILVIDDSPINLKLIKLLLLSEGYEIRTATNAPEALTVLETFSPSLIFMDLQLPGMSGLDLVRSLKKQPATKDIIVIALTAYAMLGDQQKAEAAGCDGYITKPIDTRALPGMVAEFLRRARKSGS
ncbi:response regulator [Oligoflexus tunisiensis]|uniref:response regulator n=1 Tax=Oligoflexus tunisiensis TaxID=708132 RepID=UPI00114D1722|nr:response regulator [Oligoflexus tunisiensis]